jgi:large subunit ribosomal protein L25
MAELKIQNRTIFGKKVRQLRNEGLIPAEIFGRGIKNEHISVSAKEFSKIFKEAGENTVIDLVDEKGKKTSVIVSDVASDQMKGIILSVDFHHIRMDEKIQAKVPVEFVGDAPATKKGLVLIKVLKEIEVEALPNNIPHRFEVDITGLSDSGQDIFVKDLKSNPDVKILAHGDTTIITVAEMRKEAEEVPAPATPGTATETEGEAVTAEAPVEEKSGGKKEK